MVIILKSPASFQASLWFMPHANVSDCQPEPMDFHWMSGRVSQSQFKKGKELGVQEFRGSGRACQLSQAFSWRGEKNLILSGVSMLRLVMFHRWRRPMLG